MGLLAVALLLASFFGVNDATFFPVGTNASDEILGAWPASLFFPDCGLVVTRKTVYFTNGSSILFTQSLRSCMADTTQAADVVALITPAEAGVPVFLLVATPGYIGVASASSCGFFSRQPLNSFPYPETKWVHASQMLQNSAVFVGTNSLVRVEIPIGSGVTSPIVTLSATSFPQIPPSNTPGTVFTNRGVSMGLFVTNSHQLDLALGWEGVTPTGSRIGVVSVASSSSGQPFFNYMPNLASLLSYPNVFGSRLFQGFWGGVVFVTKPTPDLPSCSVNGLFLGHLDDPLSAEITCGQYFLSSGFAFNMTQSVNNSTCELLSLVSLFLISFLLRQCLCCSCDFGPYFSWH